MIRSTRAQSSERYKYPAGIYVSDPALKLQADTLAEQTGLPIVSEKYHCKTILFLSRKGLALCTPNDPELTGFVQVDFSTPSWIRRLKRVREEQLIKAMGKKNKEKPPAKVIDATGGLGRDSFLLAAAGFQVQVFEQNPILAALLADGLHRALEDAGSAKICHRINFTPGNSIAGLRALEKKEIAEIVYLDPMFPKSNSTANVKKELQIIQQVTGEDGKKNIENLFTVSLQTATRRVVVKRPRKGSWLNDQRPAYSLTGKTIRFDIYLTTS